MPKALAASHLGSMQRTQAHVSEAEKLRRADLVARLQKYRSRLVAEGRVAGVKIVDAAISEARAEAARTGRKSK